MDKELRNQMRKEYIEKMIKNMPVLRAAANLTQAELADKVGVSRQTIVAIENGSRSLTWTMYLALLFVFKNNVESDLFDTIIVMEQAT